MKKNVLAGAGIGLTLTALLAFCAWRELPLTESLELKLYDLRHQLSVQEELSDQVVLVAVDDPSISQLGRWPWPRGVQGELIRRVASGGPKVIGVNVFWLEPDFNPGLEVVAQLKEKYDALIAGKLAALKRARADGDLEAFSASFDEAHAALDQDAQLADVLSVTPRVVLPILFSPDKPLAEEGDEALKRMPYAVPHVEAAAPGARLVPGYTPALPLPDFAGDVSGMGFSNIVPDADGGVRAQPLVFQYRGKSFPSLPLEMARLARGLDMDAVRLVPGRSLTLGDKTVPLDADSRLLIRYAGLFSDRARAVSAVDVLTDKRDPKDFKDKIVLIAPRAAGIDPVFVTPIAPVTPSVDVQLNALQGLLGDRFITRPEWAPMAELGALAFIGLIVTFLLPFLRAKGGAFVALLLLAASLGAGFWLFIAKGWWIKVFYPVALLFLSYTASMLRRFFFTEKGKELVEAEGIETNKALGLQFQQQGMLDMAFEKFRRCPVDGPMKDLLYNLALDFERKRQFGKAAAAYEHIAAADPGYKDVKSKISSSKQASETMIAGPIGRPRDGSGTLVSGASDVKPTLGKYEIQKELGRGAMGVVYLGKDPKINRMVALKTLNIDSDLDEASVKDIKERFFREAESAGTLNHPNIVKIFDADEDKATQVSYIAMELLDGEDLKKYVDKNNLLPAAMVMEHVAVIADALDYAHANGVVHRDIKPANIMKLKDGTLRVTDFGIARITASSKTATGTVLGTPSYMSPESVAGRKVDGRADLFSLGVMLYEMLTGEKPFEGDSIATLLFKISSEPHPDPTLKASARVSAAAKAVIDKALQKDPEKRYQKGADMARDIREALKNPSAAPAPAAAPAAPRAPEIVLPPAPPVPPAPPPPKPAPFELSAPPPAAPAPAKPAPSPTATTTQPLAPQPPAAPPPPPAAPKPAPAPAASPVSKLPPPPMEIPMTPEPAAPSAAAPKPAPAPTATTTQPLAPQPPASSAPPPAPKPPPPPPAAAPPPPAVHPRPAPPPIVLPPLEGLDDFKIIPTSAPAQPAAPKPAVPPPPPPSGPAPVFELERGAVPPPSAPKPPADGTVRLPPAAKPSDTVQMPPNGGHEETQKL